MKNFYFLIITVFTAALTLLGSCVSDKNKDGPIIIDVEEAVGKGSIGKLSDYVKDIKYVKLETNDSSLLGSINEILFENGLIYVSDNNNCCKIFDGNGKFIKSIQRVGRGPEEYCDVRNISINPTNGNLLVLTSIGEIVEYTKEGIFVKRVAQPEGIGNSFNFMPISNDIFFAGYFKFKKESKPENWFVIYNDSLEILSRRTDASTGFVISNSSKSEIIVSIDPFNIFKFGDRFYTSQAANDTLFCIDLANKFDLVPRYVFNFGKYKDESVRNEMPDMSREKKVITRFSYMYENENFLFLKFDMRALAPEPFERDSKISVPGISPVDVVTHVCGIYDKKKERLTLLDQPVKKKIGLLDDIAQGPVFWPVFSTSRGELISYFDAVDLITMSEEESGNYPGLAKIIQGLGENDNPVIVIAK